MHNDRHNDKRNDSQFTAEGALIPMGERQFEMSAEDWLSTVLISDTNYDIHVSPEFSTGWREFIAIAEEVTP